MKWQDNIIRRRGERRQRHRRRLWNACYITGAFVDRNGNQTQWVVDPETSYRHEPGPIEVTYER